MTTAKPRYIPRTDLYPSEKFQSGEEHPFGVRPAPLPLGDKRAVRTHLAVSKALTQWEHTEDGFARLFGVLVNPPRPSGASSRAYGSIETSRGRRGMIEAAAQVFFAAFPCDDLNTMLSQLMNHYTKAAGRRNDLAHGIVFENPHPLKGWYLTANMYTSKRSLRFEPPFYYVAAQIQTFDYNFAVLRNRALGIRTQLKALHLASPRKAREQY